MTDIQTLYQEAIKFAAEKHGPTKMTMFLMQITKKYRNKVNHHLSLEVV